jgi:hypothetical protein
MSVVAAQDIFFTVTNDMWVGMVLQMTAEENI